MKFKSFLILVGLSAPCLGMQQLYRGGQRLAPSVRAAIARSKAYPVRTATQRLFHSTPVRRMSPSIARSTLNLPPYKNLTSKDIKTARNRLALHKHTDVGGSHDEMVAINRAYEVLIENPIAEQSSGFKSSTETSRQKQSSTADKAKEQREQQAWILSDLFDAVKAGDTNKPKMLQTLA